MPGKNKTIENIAQYIQKIKISYGAENNKHKINRKFAKPTKFVRSKPNNILLFLYQYKKIFISFFYFSYFLFF